MEMQKDRPTRPRAPAVLAATAAVLALAATLFLVFWPYSYSGVSISSGQDEPVQTRASLIAVNGYRVMLVLLVPVVISSAGFLAVSRADPHHAGGRFLALLPALTLFLFCVLAAASIGILYFPSAVVLLTATILALRRRVSTE